MDIKDNKTAVSQTKYDPKSVLLIIGILIVIVGGGYLIWQRSNTNPITEMEIQELTSTLEQTSNVGEFEVPTTDPLGATVPEIDPLEAANPFTGLKVNPFE